MRDTASSSSRSTAAPPMRLFIFASSVPTQRIAKNAMALLVRLRLCASASRLTIAGMTNDKRNSTPRASRLQGALRLARN